MNISLKIISEAESFLVYVESKNMREAAEKIGVSQPALFQKIVKFEEKFPVPLFQKSGTKNTLTSFGENLYSVLLPIRKNILSNIQELLESTMNANKVELKVGGRRELIENFTEICNWKNPTQLIFLNSEQTIKSLWEKSIDFGILLNPPQEFKSKVLFKVHRELCVCKDSWKLLNTKEQFDWSTKTLQALQNLNFIAYKNPDKSIAEYFKNLGFQQSVFKNSFICEDWNLISKILSLGKGFSIIPSNISTDENIIRVPIPRSRDSSENIYLCYYPENKRVSGLRGIFQKVSAKV
jgi:DNA-binding transcriptional LysR family regulator